MFEITCKMVRDVSPGDAVRCEFLGSEKLLVKSTKGDLLGITGVLNKGVVDSHYISHQRPLYGVVIKVSEDDCLLHMVAPGRIKGEFQKVKQAEIIPFPPVREKEAA